MSKHLLLFLLFFLFENTNGCLVVKPKNPNLGNCQCNVNLFNQQDIRNNKGGKYLGNQKAWDPIVTSGDDCKLKVACNPDSGVSSFMTVMFRSNGNPLYINRVINGQSTYLPQPRDLSDVHFDCRETNDGSSQWFYQGVHIQDLSFSCVADENSCQCPPTAINLAVQTSNRATGGAHCGFFSASCTREAEEGTNIPFLFSDETFAISSGSSTNVTQYDEYMCLKEDDGSFNWYFSNLRLPLPSLACRSDVEIYGEPQTDSCGYFKTIRSVDDFEWYHRVGDYDKATFGEAADAKEKEFIMSCETGFTAVVFSENNDPIEVLGYNGLVICTEHPLNKNVKIWIANGTRLLNPAYACAKLVIPPEMVPMNGCQCPQIKYLGAGKIQEMDAHSNWLARKLTIPPFVSVTDDCEVSFRADPYGPSDFDFMLFRDEAPPIFMRRLLANETKPEKVILSDLTCQKINNSLYQWNYKSSKITDKTLYVTAQINNDPGCSCMEFKTGPGMTMTKVNGTCDILNFQCDQERIGVSVAFRPFGGSAAVLKDHEINQGLLPSITLVGATCFNYDWYFNGQKITNPSASCKPQPIPSDYTAFAVNCLCSQPGIFQSPSASNVTAFWKTFSFLYPSSERFRDRVSQNPQVSNFPSGCRMEYKCLGDDTMVVFGSNVEPMIYPAGKIPEFRCVSPPLAGNLQTEKYWWIDNVMVNMPQIGCFARIAEIDEPEIDMGGCKCPQVTFIDQEGVKNLGNYSSWLGSKETLKPKITVSENCEILIDKSELDVKDHNIVLFRKEAPPLYLRRYLTSDPVQVPLSDLVCNRETSEPYWEYEGQLVSKEPIYLTVQLNTGACSCDPFGIESSLSIAEHGGVCDYMQITCPNANDTVMLNVNTVNFPTAQIFFPLYQSDMQLASAVCSDSQWYFNGITISSPTVNCQKPFINSDQEEFYETCGCYAALTVAGSVWKEMKFDDVIYQLLDTRRTLFNRTFTDSQYEYTLSTCGLSVTCPDGSQAALLSMEDGPQFLPAGETLEAKCMAPPLAQSKRTEWYWWNWNRMSYLFGVVCVEKLEEYPIEMNGCQCPPLKHIDQEGISKMPESSYLNNRETFRPEVTVSSTCEVTMDVSSIPIDKFFLMLFRKEKSPVFMRRFYSVAEKQQLVQLTDLVCKQVLGVYQWQYNDMKLTDSTLYVALQSNQEMCGCPSIDVDSEKLNYSFSPDRCDILEIECVNSQTWEGPRLLDNTDIVQTVMQGVSHQMSLTSATCVNSQWIFNGNPLKSPKLTCGDWAHGDLDFEDFGSVCPCSRITMHRAQPETDTHFWEEFIYNYDPNAAYTFKPTIQGAILYQSSKCSIKYTCPKYDQELVIFRLNGDPMIYPSGNTPDLKCVKPPSSGVLNSDRVWWIDDEIVIMPMFACYQREGCKCSRIHDLQRLGLLENSKHLEHREIFSPRLEVTDSCEVSVDVSKSTVDNYFLLFNRYPQSPIFFRRFTASDNKNVLHKLDDLKCIQTGQDQYMWHHGTVPISDSISMTLMSDEECGCPDFEPLNEVQISKMEGSCNVLRLKAPHETDLIVIGHTEETEVMLPWDVTIAELTCINKTWYYNNFAIKTPRTIYFPNIFLMDSEKCRCRAFIKFDDASYTLDEETCKLSLSCPEGKKYNIDSVFKKFYYNSSTEIDVQCAKQPATSAFSPLYDMEYWINGDLALVPRFKCI